jgi:hypothetical protein
MRLVLFASLGALFFAGGCPKATQEPPPVEVKAQKRYDLASHRCAGKGKTCTCRDLSDPGDAPEQNAVPAGKRRFEVRLASLDRAVVLQFAGQPYELRPNGESPEAQCWYLDLPEGGFSNASLRAREHEGIPTHATVAVSEFRPDSGRWLSVFSLRCGDSTQPCSPEEMAREKPRILGTRDKCARSDVRSVQWQGSQLEGRYLSFAVSVDLVIAESDSAQDPACKGGAPTE